MVHNVGQPLPPEAFESAMVFVDGTNLFSRLSEEKLVVPNLRKLFERICRPRRLYRVYVYTTRDHLERAQAVHGPDFLRECRIVLGDQVSTGDGKVKEKCVDALLVADLIYHAAMKNCQLAYLVTHDSDFRYAIRRVEDFGCRTAVVAIGPDAPDRLRLECDEYIHPTKHDLTIDHLAESAP